MSNNTHVQAEDYDTRGLLWFFVDGIYVGIVSIIGIFGNLLSIVVFSKPKFRFPINCILIGLAVADTIILLAALKMASINQLILFFAPGTPYLYGSLILYIQVACFTISSAGIAASTFCTVGISAERYLAVCHPFKARAHATWRHASIFVASVFLYSVLVNIPRPFFYIIKTSEQWSPVRNETIVDHNLQFPEGTLELRKVFSTTIPTINFVASLVFLAFFNLRIYTEIAKANRLRETLTAQQKQNIKVTNMLIGIVIVFLLTNTPKMIYLIALYVFNNPAIFFFKISHSMYVTNSATNFVIYMFKVKQFRVEVRNMMRPLWVTLGWKRKVDPEIPTTLCDISQTQNR